MQRSLTLVYKFQGVPVTFECASQSNFFSKKELSRVQSRPIPRHVAIIPDGNRRWAEKQSDFNLMNGHWVGASVVNKIVEAAFDIGIEVLTLYSFSTENWNRTDLEIETILNVIEMFLKENRQLMVEKGVRFETIGDLNPLPESIKDEIYKAKEATRENNSIGLVLALNYGARDEMRRAMLSMIADMEKGLIVKEEIKEETIRGYLDTACYRDPELLIRTSGEKRFSNFLLWQSAYTEIYVTDVLWPDFTPRHLLNAVLDFQRRRRRLGR